MDNVTLIVCGECNDGYLWQEGPDQFICACSHEVTRADILPNLDPGESLLLYRATESMYCLAYTTN